MTKDTSQRATKPDIECYEHKIECCNNTRSQRVFYLNKILSNIHKKGSYLKTQHLTILFIKHHTKSMNNTLNKHLRIKMKKLNA